MVRHILDGLQCYWDEQSQTFSCFSFYLAFLVNKRSSFVQLDCSVYLDCTALIVFFSWVIFVLCVIVYYCPLALNEINNFNYYKQVPCVQCRCLCLCSCMLCTEHVHHSSIPQYLLIDPTSLLTCGLSFCPLVPLLCFLESQIIHFETWSVLHWMGDGAKVDCILSQICLLVNPISQNRGSPCLLPKSAL